MRRLVGRGALLCVLVASLVGGWAGSGGSASSPSSTWPTFGAGTSRTGYSPIAVSSLGRAFVLPLSGRITSQVLAADGLFFATSNAGDVVAFDRDGFVHWRRNVGQLAHSCQQLDGYGVVGTGVIDPQAQTLYAVDAFGRLHAFALSSGVERSGFPIRLFPTFTQQVDWGALTLAGGSLYVPTAAYCDTPLTSGGVHAVDLATRKVTTWRVVPKESGGGGGPWGWGGLAFDPESQALFAATSGAFSGGENRGASFTETEGLGDRLVQLSPDLAVQTSSHPPELPDNQDLDFVGSPLLVETPACGKLVIAATKNDTVYGWRQDAIAAGPIWTVSIEPYDIANPYVGQLAWSPKTASVYAVTGTQFVRIAVDGSCQGSIAWRRPLGTNSENGSPTVAGNTVWFADNGKRALVGYDARTGAKVFQAALGGISVQAPTVVRGRVLIGTFAGTVDAFKTPSGNADPATTAGPRSSSWADSAHGWQSRSGGVYATTDGGRSWRRIYPHPAIAIAMVGPTAGVISTGYAPGACMCATRQLWTTDNGATWHDTPTLTGSFQVAAGRVFFWKNGVLRVLAPLPRTATRRLGAATIANVADGTIVDAARTPDGLVALVSTRSAGQGWDNAPRVLVADPTAATTVVLPRQAGHPLAQAIAVAGDTVTVTATDFTVEPATTTTWTSHDRGRTWAAG